MTAEVAPITDLTLERSTQLINKSNQFNLTTIRRSTAEVLALSRDPRWLTRTVSLTDRFGDNGLISVLLAKIEGDRLEIDTWLMSCRVLKRNVEQLLLNEICRVALDHGLGRVGGRYVPTGKNGLVENHYIGLGFNLVERSTDGQCRYELDLTNFTLRETFIQVRQAS